MMFGRDYTGIFKYPGILEYFRFRFRENLFFRTEVHHRQHFKW